MASKKAGPVTTIRVPKKTVSKEHKLSTEPATSPTSATSPSPTAAAAATATGVISTGSSNNSDVVSTTSTATSTSSSSSSTNGTASAISSSSSTSSTPTLPPVATAAKRSVTSTIPAPTRSSNLGGSSGSSKPKPTSSHTSGTPARAPPGGILPPASSPTGGNRRPIGVSNTNSSTTTTATTGTLKKTPSGSPPPGGRGRTIVQTTIRTAGVKKETKAPTKQGKGVPAKTTAIYSASRATSNTPPIPTHSMPPINTNEEILLVVGTSVSRPITAATAAAMNGKDNGSEEVIASSGTVNGEEETPNDDEFDTHEGDSKEDFDGIDEDGGAVCSIPPFKKVGDWNAPAVDIEDLQARLVCLYLNFSLISSSFRGLYPIEMMITRCRQSEMLGSTESLADLLAADWKTVPLPRHNHKPSRPEFDSGTIS
jgi:hypothetical protein